MQIVAVTVHRHRGDVHELGLFFAQLLHLVHHVAGADIVGEFGAFGIVIGRGRDDRPHMKDVIRVRDKLLAGLRVRKVSPHRFCALAEHSARGGGKLLVPAVAADEELDLLHLIEFEELPQALLTHISACSGESDDDRHKSLLALFYALILPRHSYHVLTKTLHFSYICLNAPTRTRTRALLLTPVIKGG